MVIDVVPHIEKLLYSNDILIIPDFGAFQSTPTPAKADAAGGTVAPPSRALIFDETLSTDDGVLVHDIATTHNIPEDQAQEIIRNFVTATQEQLNKREIVTLPGIGRLYKNYIQKIQFLPDSNNFNASSYGLPPLQFSPIARSREIKEEVAAPPQEAVSSPPALQRPTPPVDTPMVEKPSSDSARWLPLIGFGVVLTLIVAGIVFLRPKHKSSESTTAPITENQAEPAAKTPVASPTKAKSDQHETASLSVPDTPTKQEPELVEPQKEAPAPSAAPKEKPATTTGKQCIIIIGVFKDAGNIRQLQEKLSKNNFTLYEAPAKNGKQIGVQFNYQNISEIQQNLNQLQALTGVADLWIKKK